MEHILNCLDPYIVWTPIYDYPYITGFWRILICQHWRGCRQDVDITRDTQNIPEYVYIYIHTHMYIQFVMWVFLHSCRITNSRERARSGKPSTRAWATSARRTGRSVFHWRRREGPLRALGAEGLVVWVTGAWWGMGEWDDYGCYRSSFPTKYISR